jgi:hypothetical protein
MALVKCEECEKSISDQAENCVHCGAPMSMQSAIQVNDETAVERNWFNSAAKSAVLNGLWLGPVNIYYWFQSGRFDDRRYSFEARVNNTDLDTIILIVLVAEMLLMLFSLFTVYAIFKLAKATENTFTWIMFMVFATVLWTALGMLFGL